MADVLSSPSWLERGIWRLCISLTNGGPWWCSHWRRGFLGRSHLAVRDVFVVAANGGRLILALLVGEGNMEIMHLFDEFGHVRCLWWVFKVPLSRVLRIPT